MVAAPPTYLTIVSMNERERDEEMKTHLSLVSSTPLLPTPTPQLSFKFDRNKQPQEEKRLGPDYEPSKFDVICSKGKEARDHTGNKRFRMLIDMNLQRYREAKSKVLKSTIVTDIVDAITSASSGGFIKKIEGEWHQVSDHHAREKVGQSFRDRLRNEYKSSSKAKIRKRKMEEERMLRLPISSSLGIGSEAEGDKNMACSSSSAALPNDRQSMMTPFDSPSSAWAANHSLMNLQTNPIPISSFAPSSSSSSILAKTGLPDYTRNMLLPQGGGDLPLERINSRSMFQRPAEELSSQSMLRNHIIGNHQHPASRQLDLKMGRQMMLDDNPINMNYNDGSSLRSLRYPTDNDSFLRGGMQSSSSSFFHEDSALLQQNHRHGRNRNTFLDMPPLGPVDCFTGSIPSSFNPTTTTTRNRIQHNNGAGSDDGMRMPTSMETRFYRNLAAAQHPGRSSLLEMNTFDTNGTEESIDNSRGVASGRGAAAGFPVSGFTNNNTQRPVIADSGTSQARDTEVLQNNNTDILEREEDSTPPVDVEPTSSARREASLGLLSFSSGSDRDSGTFSQEIFGDVQQQLQQQQRDEAHRNE